jgi:tripartite-type tricarboxylate transporter receptor subunit TctC
MKKLSTRLVLLGAACLASVNLAFAQPADQPIRFIVITAPGGAADQFARMVGERLATALGRTVLVENKPGAGGNIASQFVAKAAPDGNTFLITSNNHTVNPSLYAKPGYTFDELVPVVQIARGPSVMVVHPSSPFHSVKELIESARTKPLPYGSIGVGSGAHLVAECLKAATGAKLEHVPYKGGAPAVADVVGGQVPAVMTTLASAGAFIKAERIRALAVSSNGRWALTPNIPTLGENGWGECSIETWIGMMAPKGTPAVVIARVNAATAAILKTAEAKEKMVPTGYEPVGESVQHFGTMLRTDLDRMTRLIKQAGISAE